MSRAAAAREAARASDGRFGSQPRADPGGDVAVVGEIDEQDWAERFGGHVPSDSGGFYIEDRSELAAIDERHIWTALEDDEPVRLIPGADLTPGFVYVRTVGPWTDDDQVLQVVLDDERTPCRAASCHEPVDGDGWDGHCSWHADLATQHEDGEHDEQENLDCPDCV